MTKLMAALVALAMIVSTGCIVRTRSAGRASTRARACPPAHHWDGYGCVHNGRARGHYKRGR
jgi:hypothetical protein